MGPKIPYLVIFGLQFNKNYYHIFNQYSRIYETIKFHPKQKKINLGPKMLYWGLWAICLIANFCAKIKILKFGTKNALFGCFSEHFWKTIVLFVIRAHSNLSYSKVWCRNTLNLGAKMSVWVFFDWNYKTYCHIWNQHLKTCLTAKIRGKTKMPKFGTKIPYLGIFDLEIESNIIIFEINTLKFV